MKSSLSLRQKLRVLVAVPLGGALVFALFGAYGDARVARELRNGRRSANFARELQRLDAAVSEEADAFWLGQVRVAAEAAQRVDERAQRLRDFAARAFGPLAGEAAESFSRLVQTSAALAEVRTRLGHGETRPAGELSRALGDAHGQIRAEIARLVLALSAATADSALRSRFQELGWSLQLSAAADQGRRALEANADTERVTAAMITEVDYQQWHRRFAERQLQLGAAPDRRAVWLALVRSKPYLRSDALSDQWRNNATPGKSASLSPAERGEWQETSRERRDALAAAVQSVADELANFATTSYRATLRHLGLALALAAAIAAVSIGVAWTIVRRIHHILTETLRDLTQGNGRIDSVMDEMKASTKRLADAAAQEAASLQETAASLQELSSMNQQNSGTAQASAEQMNEIAALVNTSSEAMRTLVGKMTDISKASEETQKIIQTIREIAFQTNILALNASIEAARAGEAGTGFKVVAEEIRQLAKRAAEASTETDRIIAHSHGSIVQSAELCARVDRTFHAAESNALNCRELTQQIRVASEEVSRGVEHIRSATENMNAVMNQNVAISEENAGTTGLLFTQAHELAATIRHLERLVFGAETERASA